MRLPIDGTSMPGLLIDPAPRVSWLIATSRLYSSVPAAHRRETFAVALAEHGVNADLTRISRWESGSVPVPDKVVAAYAAALGFPPGQLITAVAGLRRSLRPRAADGPFVVPDLPDVRDDRDAMFDRILSGEHTGVDWTRLMITMESSDHVYLPQPMWSELCDTLIEELVRSTAFSWLRRYEAARTLVRNPATRRSMMRALGARITTPGAQAIEPVICLLQEIADPQADALAIRMLGSPNKSVRRGAAWAVANKLGRGHFDEEHLDRLSDWLPSRLVRRDVRTLSSSAVDILAALPSGHADVVLNRLGADPAVGDLRQQLQSGELLPTDRARRLSASLAHTVESELQPHQPVEHDEMLARLIREALLHVHRERRHQASVLLALSPYGPTLSAHLLTGLAGTAPSVAARGLTMLNYLGASEDSRGQLLTWSTHHPDLRLRSRAIEALAHLPDPITADEQERIVQLIGTGSPDVSAAALYALGRSSSAALGDLTFDTDPAVRDIAEWWLSLGPTLTDEWVH